MTWLVFLMLTGAGTGYAQLEEHEVLLVYNSLHAESSEIAQHYMQARPGVVPFDLQIEYISGHPQNPGVLAANFRYITPQAFLDWVRTPILDFLATDPRGADILAMVTTRGVPSLVTTDFSIGPGHLELPGIRGGVESLMARLGMGTPAKWEVDFVASSASPTVMQTMNPYYARFNVPFRLFVSEEHAGDFCHDDGWGGPGGPQHAGKLFLVTRLDSDPPNPGPSGLEIGTYVDGVKALIDRSQSLVVNKYATTLVVDSCSNSHLGRDRVGLQYMHQTGWCTYYDDTPAFLFGADSPYADFSLEHLAYPELLHASFGRNNQPLCGGAPVDDCYVSGLVPHPAGLFVSIESYNGYSIRAPGHGAVPPSCGNPGVGWEHGQALRWIARGGAFASGSVVGQTSVPILHADYVLANIYEHGLSWAEAVYTSLTSLGHYQTPIGDPLARVTVHDPDINDDGVWDDDDVQLLLTLLGTPGPLGDVNGDGIVDAADLAIVADYNGRDCSTDPMAASGQWPIPVPSGFNWHGDAKGAPLGLVDRHDLDWTLTRYGQYCGSDLTGDGVVDEYDVLSVLCNWGRLAGDVNQDCAVEIWDLLEVLGDWGACPWPCSSDVGGVPGSQGYTYGPDGVVNDNDVTVVNLQLGMTSEDCHEPPSSDDMAAAEPFMPQAWLQTDGSLDVAACDLLESWFGNPAYD